ncbi:uncharacterized protein [Ptychodera flava]|uniref:uncharacterized protein isoform X1 n=1 Tax=Ptychodera flava TaxID=63121 RepID=UPI003969D34E
MALLKSLFHVLATIVFVFLVSACALQCPDSYPIKSCPQPYEPINNRECCYTREKGYHCCAGGLPPWGIAIVVILAIGLVGLGVGLGFCWYFGKLDRCCCCRCCPKCKKNKEPTEKSSKSKSKSQTVEYKVVSGDEKQEEGEIAVEEGDKEPNA